jgi:hypothetical protein
MAEGPYKGTYSLCAWQEHYGLVKLSPFKSWAALKRELKKFFVGHRMTPEAQQVRGQLANM